MTTTIAPPPPAPPPPPLSPGGRTAVRATLIVAAVVLVVGTLVSLGVLAWGASGFRVVADDRALPATMRSLVVDAGPVPVAIRITTDREASEPRVDLRMVNSQRASANPLEVNADGSEVRITLTGEPTPFLQWTRGGEITVVLPPEVARRLNVTTEQDTGMVHLRADVDRLTARVDDGAVLLSGSARRVEVHNVHGQVRSRDAIAVAESFSATTVHGDIEVDFADVVPKSVEATSQDGDVVLGLPAEGTYLVDASTGDRHGSTVVRVPRTTDRNAADAVITARTDHGDVVIDELD
ncbi:DUF4097 family beta strand repeat-containing protein [Mycolicibacterium phlei]